METLDDYCTWFRAEAQKLPHYTKEDVMCALANADPRVVHLWLNRMLRAGELPEAWGPVLEAFYWKFCY